jgi:hypothetical protein
MSDDKRGEELPAALNFLEDFSEISLRHAFGDTLGHPDRRVARVSGSPAPESRAEPSCMEAHYLRHFQ